MNVLGVTYAHCEFPEAIYRDYNGRVLYNSLRDLFRGITSEDEIMVDIIKDKILSCIDKLNCNDICLHVPAGIGNHVDHILVRRAAEYVGRKLGCARKYYVELPYGLRYSCASGVLSIVSGVDLEKKILAALCYQSQINTLWGNHEEMMARILMAARQRCGKFAEHYL